MALIILSFPFYWFLNDINNVASIQMAFLVGCIIEIYTHKHKCTCNEFISLYFYRFLTKGRFNGKLIDPISFKRFENTEFSIDDLRNNFKFCSYVAIVDFEKLSEYYRTDFSAIKRTDILPFIFIHSHEVDEVIKSKEALPIGVFIKDKTQLCVILN